MQILDKHSFSFSSHSFNSLEKPLINKLSFINDKSIHTKNGININDVNIKIKVDPDLTFDWIINELNAKPLHWDENLDIAKNYFVHAQLKGGFIEGADDDLNMSISRTEFALLALVNDEALKVDSLDHLINLLKNNPIDAKSFHNLMVLERNCREYMRPEIIQEQNLYIQIKMVRAYALLLECMVSHCYKGNAGAITRARKEDIWSTAEGIQKLNRDGNIVLEAQVRRTIEAAKRIKSDESTLAKIVKRSKHFVQTLLLIKSEAYVSALEQLQSTFHHICIKSGWYDGMIEIKKLAKLAKEDTIALSMLQELVHDRCYKENSDWELVASCIDALGEIALEGKTPEIRMAAAIGDYSIEAHPRPGLISFTNYNEYTFHSNWKIRFTAVDALIRVRESDDRNVKKAVGDEILKRKKLEPEEFSEWHNRSQKTQQLLENNDSKTMIWYRTSDQNVKQHYQPSVK